MIIVLICLMFFSSVVFGQLPCPQPNNSTEKCLTGNVTGTVFYKDGKTPIPLQFNPTCGVILTGQSSINSTSIDDSGNFYLQNVNASDNPYYLYYVYDVDNGPQDYFSDDFNVTPGKTTVVNVTTSRMLTN